jgi:hypothetical protein
MLDEKSGFALIPGAVRPDKETTMKVKATRRFWFGGALVEPEAEVDLPESVAHEVIASNKAVTVLEAAPSRQAKPKEPAESQKK